MAAFHYNNVSCSFIVHLTLLMFVHFIGIDKMICKSLNPEHFTAHAHRIIFLFRIFPTYYNILTLHNSFVIGLRNNPNSKRKGDPEHTWTGVSLFII